MLNTRVLYSTFVLTAYTLLLFQKLKKSVLVDIMGTFCSLLQLSGKMLLSCNSSSTSKTSISNNSSLSSLLVEINFSSKFEFSSAYKRIFLFHHQNGR